jgi:hypothetical protein
MTGSAMNRILNIWEGYITRRPGRQSVRAFVMQRSLTRHELERPVIVAMIPMRMMQVAVDQIIDMIAMRHRLVTAIRTVLVIARMAAAIMIRRALVGIAGAHVDGVFVEVILMRVMKVAIMEIVHVIAVLYRGVAAARTMLVGMVVMDVMLGHS